MLTEAAQEEACRSGGGGGGGGRGGLLGLDEPFGTPSSNTLTACYLDLDSLLLLVPQVCDCP